MVWNNDDQAARKKGQHVRIIRHDTEENNSFPVFFIVAPLKTNPLISIVILNINLRLFYRNSVFIFFSLSLLYNNFVFRSFHEEEAKTERERESRQKPRRFSNQNKLLVRQRRARIQRFRRGLSIGPADFILVIRS